MKHRLISLSIIILISLNAVGCSIVRVVQTNAGQAVEKTVKDSEERRTALDKRDFRLGFNATGSELGVRLEYRPYYAVERRQLVTYKPSSGGRPLEVLVGVAGLGLLTWAVVDNLVETGEVEVNDEGELYNVKHLDWNGANPLHKAIIIGVPLDCLLWAYYATEYKATAHEPWEKRSEITGEWQLLGDHPYRVELPIYNFGRNYQSRSGNERVQVSRFLSGVTNPNRFNEIDSVLFRASTKFNGETYHKDLKLTAPAQLRPFHDAALAALDIDMISTGKPRLMPRPEVTTRWSNKSVQAGNVATLRVTIRNTGKGAVYRFIGLTTSSNPKFNNRELKFGKIEPGESRTALVSFELDKLMRTQEFPIGIRFGEYNDHVPENIAVKLNVFEVPRPRFDYAYHIIDGGTDTSVGNGDGILQRGESIDILVTVRNSGEGPAAGVTARLNLLERTGVDIYGDTLANLSTLAPGASKTAMFNVGVKRTASMSRLLLNLSVQENNFGSETELTKTLNLPIGRAAGPKVRIVNLVGTVRSNSAQVYNGAASSTPIRAEIPQDSQIKVSGQLGDWYRVELLNFRDQALTGWVHEEQLLTAKTSRRPSSQVEKPPMVEVFQNTPPTLELLEPTQQDIEVEDRTLVVQAHAVSNKGIKKVELTVNGRTKNTRNITKRDGNTTFRIKENISLNDGENTIRLRAFDTDNQASETIVLSVTHEREQVRQDYALLFGVNSYEHFDPWHKLNNPIPDAEAIGNELKNRYGFVVELVSDPTRDDILRKINEYAQKQYNQNDQLLIFFAGHGYFEEANQTGIGYLVASDTLPPDADPGKSSYVSHEDMRGRVENIGCEHIFLMIDACFSGTFDPLVAQLNRARGGNRIPDDISRRKFIKQTLAYKSRWFLTSGGKEYVSDGRPNQHSPFTRRVLDALRSNSGRHSILTLDDIRRYVEKTSPQPRAGEFGSNAPGSNFLFIPE